MEEILQHKAFESHPDNQRGEEVCCTVWNDLKVAAAVKLGQGSEWQIVYPDASLKLAIDSATIDLQVFVRLRDDPNVSGICTATQGSTFQLSSSFGDFGDRARKHVQEEETAAQEESRLRQQRRAELDRKYGAEVTQTILWKQKWVMISSFLCTLIFFTAMISCTVAAFLLEAELQGLGLALGLLGLFGCAGGGVIAIAAAADEEVVDDLRRSVQAARPELERYEDKGVVADGDWRLLMTLSCLCCFPLVFLGCLVAMTVAFPLNGNGYLAAVLWGPVALMICCGGIFAWRDGDGGLREKAGNALATALVFPFTWPFFILEDKCGFKSRLAAFFLKPPKRSLDTAVHTTQARTIVFEGNVLAKCETVCSWPGKYATAWDELVAGSRQDDISAAVVFLPEGSEHYGFHDPIPAKQDLRGKCWCTPLYGERKPWGCRWWSKWIANIEEAVSQECTLVVYYFNGMKGQGKVEDFTTAGNEHVRREAIFRCKDAFLKSNSFQHALEGGLKHLSKEQGPDSSSPYSREVHRLFLATLSEEDRRVLNASEGLGNSQKAEVAWLERKGYPYIEKEVWELASSAPEAIERAT